MRLIYMTLPAAILLAQISSATAQDAAAGEKIFSKCKVCHIIDGDKHKVGPSLKGIFGRTAGTAEGFKFSTAMIDAGKGGLIWDDANMQPYLKDPKGTIKGTKMAFAGLKKDDEIANVIAYMKQFSQ